MVEGVYKAEIYYNDSSGECRSEKDFLEMIDNVLTSCDIVRGNFFISHAKRIDDKELPTDD